MKKNDKVKLNVRIFRAMTFFSGNALKCISMNNQEHRIRLEIINVQSNESYSGKQMQW